MEEVLNSELLINRLMELEYKEVTVENINKIYIEETGKEPPSNIEVYYSDDFVDEANANGFNGTIIHFFDEKKEINQSYTITRGSETVEAGENEWRPEDWAYNAFGVFLGSNTAQYDAALEFDKKVTEKISNNSKVSSSNTELKKIGLGHSLGGNLNTLIQLTTGRYDQVYTTNPAPPTFYQLASIDIDFNETIIEEFNR